MRKTNEDSKLTEDPRLFKKGSQPLTVTHGRRTKMEDKQDLAVLAFRLDQMETVIAEANRKLDQLLDRQQSFLTEVALVKLHQEQIDKRLYSAEKKLENLGGATTDLKISLAERIGPGAIAGAVVGALFFIIKFFAGVG